MRGGEEGKKEGRKRERADLDRLKRQIEGREEKSEE